MSSRVSFQSQLSDALSKARSVAYDNTDNNSVTSQHTNTSTLSNASFQKMMAAHNSNKYLWKNVLRDRDEIEVILNAIDQKSYHKLAEFHQQNPNSPIHDIDVFSTSPNEEMDEFDENEAPRYALPTVTSVLPPSAHDELEKVRNSYGPASYSSIKKLPDQLDSGVVQMKVKQQIVENLLQQKPFKTSTVPRDTDFIPSQHIGTDYDKIHNLNKLIIEEEKVKFESQSRRPFVVSSRIRSKFEDIFFDPSFRIPNLGPGGGNRKLESITRADLLNEKNYKYGRFNLYGNKMTIGLQSGNLIKHWLQHLHELLVQDWKEYQFRIKFTKSHELLIQFLQPDPNDKEKDEPLLLRPLPTSPTKLNNTSADTDNPSVKPIVKILPPLPPNNALQKYMNRLAAHGLAREFGLAKRGDRWNVLEKEFVEDATISNSPRESDGDSITYADDEEDVPTPPIETTTPVVEGGSEVPKRNKRFSLLRTSLTQQRGSFLRMPSDDDNNPNTPITGGHLPPRNSMLVSGMNVSYDEHHREPPAAQLISKVLAGLEGENNNITPTATSPVGSNDVQQLSEDLITHHVAYLVNRLGFGGPAKTRSRSVVTNTSVMSTQGTVGDQSRQGSMKAFGKSVSFHSSVAGANSGSLDDRDSTTSPEKRGLGAGAVAGLPGLNLSHSGSGSALNTPTNNSGSVGGGGSNNAPPADMRKSLLRASLGFNTLETMKEETNEDHIESSVDQSRNNSTTSSSANHSSEDKRSVLSKDHGNNPIKIPSKEELLYRKKEREELPPSEPQIAYYLTFSFYAPWVSTKQHTVHRKTAHEERTRAREYHQKQKRRLRMLSPLSADSTGRRRKNGDIGNITSLDEGTLQGGGGGVPPYPVGNANTTPNGYNNPVVAQAITALLSGRPHLSAPSNETEGNALIFGSRQMSSLSHLSYRP
eukprot:gene14602-16181_t